MKFIAELDRAQIVAATGTTHRFWGTTLERNAYIQLNLERVDRAAGMLRFCGVVAEGRLIASMKWYDLQLQIPGAEGASQVRCVGVGAVFTEPESRGRGAAGLMLRSVRSLASEQGYAAAMLYSDIDPAFYHQFGYFVMPAMVCSIRPEQLPDASPLTIESRPPDRTRMIAWHRQQLGDEWLGLWRTRQSWDFFRWWNRDERHDRLLTCDGIGVGYLNCRIRKERLLLEEWAIPAELEPQMWAALKSLAMQNGVTQITGWWPNGRTPDGCQQVQRKQSVPMIRLFDPKLSLDLALRRGTVHFGQLDYF